VRPPSSSPYLLLLLPTVYGDESLLTWSCASFATTPGAGDADLRMTYCAFIVCALLGDWSCVDIPRALSYIQRCRVRVYLLLPSPLPHPDHRVFFLLRPNKR
jgi:hypothetical protein